MISNKFISLPIFFAFFVVGVFFPKVSFSDTIDDRLDEYLEELGDNGFRGVEWCLKRTEFVQKRPNIDLSSRNLIDHRKSGAPKEQFFDYEAEILYLFKKQNKWDGFWLFLSAPDKKQFLEVMVRLFKEPSKQTGNGPFRRWQLGKFSVITIPANARAPIFFDANCN